MTTALSPNELYGQDFCAWTRDQARELRRLREARSDVPLDLKHLAEEVADLGKAERNALRIWTRHILAHLLLLDHSPAADRRPGWRNEIRTARASVEDTISPTLRRDLRRRLSKLYAVARATAVDKLVEHRETGAIAGIPTTCPYTLDQILGDWWPDTDDGDAR